MLMNAIALRSAFKSEYIFSTILSVSISQVIACSLRTEEKSFSLHHLRISFSPNSLPGLLHWQTPYGTAMSYTVSTSYIYTVPVCPTVQFLSLCRLHLQSFFQNIDTCIRIPVMNRMAFGTLPDTNAQIFYPWISVATTAAGLTARIHRWYSVNFISIPASFIFQHFKKFCPGNTCYGF